MSERPAHVIEIQRVIKRFGPVVAVDRVSLALEENEFFALLGPSGCGKTTLLRVIAGFERPDEGRVLLDGKDLGGVRPNHRPINMMFQSYALFPHLSVFENVAYGLRMENVRKEELRRRVEEALDMVQLGAMAGRRPHQLSGGQGQRVALARALIKRPRVLLLDEPLGALDRKLRQQMEFELKKLQHEVGITFVVVTHDQEEALVMADRIALMREGRVAQLGPSRELYENPADHFVASFIGEMNFFEGRAIAEGVEVPGLGCLRGRRDSRVTGAPAYLGVRPEKITLHRSAPVEPPDNCLSGVVEDIAYYGEDVTVHVRIEGQPEPLTVKAGSADERILGLSPGARVWCSWPAASSRVLPRE